jgi:hypothetical protein
MIQYRKNSLQICDACLTVAVLSRPDTSSAGLDRAEVTFISINLCPVGDTLT